MGIMMLLGAVLVVIWLLALVIFKMVGFAIHLLLIAGIVLLIWGFVRRGADAVRRRV
jgi:hypothetical protein